MNCRQESYRNIKVKVDLFDDASEKEAKPEEDDAEEEDTEEEFH